ncbi:hypothetical protein [Cribrihabitans neustonicus]|uniref:hypothetical protein n=1 Tax=Cribrihabitans neustonicus TaxID=1429085 RepID=UPI003B5C4862
MSRSLALFAIGLVFGGGAGFVTAAGNGVTFDGHDHGGPAHHGGGQAEIAGHAHGTATDLPAGGDAPRVALEVMKDPMSGWNLQATTENFRFAPQNASAADAAGEGHAHVYVNGEKVARLYGEWLHIPSLPAGSAEVTVSLNSNSHSPLTVKGEPVTASVTVQSDGEGL